MKTLPTVLLAAAPLVAAGILVRSPAPAVACAAEQSGTAVHATVVGIPGSEAVAVAVAGLSRYGPVTASAGGPDLALRGSGSATGPLVVAGAGVGDAQKGTDEGAFTQSIVASSCI